MRLSFSKAETFLTCGRKYYYKYVKRIVPLVTGVALPFGRAIHSACTAYVASLSLGRSTDIVQDFLSAWQTETNGLSLEYPAHFDFDAMTEMGKTMSDRFPETWNKAGLVAVLDENGTPLVEQKCSIPLGDGEHELVFVIDILALHLNTAAYGVLDLKTAAQEHTEFFGENSNQLTIYQHGADSAYGKWLGADISNVGFMDCLKRKADTPSGTGPLVQPPRFYKRRSPEAVTEVLDQLNHVATQIQANRFFRPMNGSFNSPCNTCEFARLCIHNDTQGYATSQKEAA